MKHNEFLEKLDKAKLNKKEFVAITGLAYSTVANWSSSDNIPHWVKSWLENYIEKKKLDTLKETMKATGICETLK